VALWVTYLARQLPMVAKFSLTMQKMLLRLGLCPGPRWQLLPLAGFGYAIAEKA